MARSRTKRGHEWLLHQQLTQVNPIHGEPKDAGYEIALGNALHYFNRFAEAEQAFRKALALGAKEADLHVSLGLVLNRQNRRDEAMREFRQAQQIDPDNRRARKALQGMRGKAGE